MQYPGLYNSLRFYSTENYIRKELRLLHSQILPCETWDMKWPVWSAKNNSLLFRVASESRGIASPRSSLRTNHVCSVRSSILYPLLQSARGTDYGLLVGNIYHNYGDKVVLHAHENCVLFIISCVVLYTLYFDIKLISYFRWHGSLTWMNSRTKVMLGRSTSCSCSWSLLSPPPTWLRTRYVDSSPISLLHLFLERNEVSLQISFLLEMTFWSLKHLYIFIFSRTVSFTSSGWTERVSAPAATELTPSHQLVKFNC